MCTLQIFIDQFKQLLVSIQINWIQGYICSIYIMNSDKPIVFFPMLKIFWIEKQLPQTYNHMNIWIIYQQQQSSNERITNKKKYTEEFS